MINKDEKAEILRMCNTIWNYNYTLKEKHPDNKHYFRNVSMVNTLTAYINSVAK